MLGENTGITNGNYLSDSKRHYQYIKREKWINYKCSLDSGRG